MNLSRENLILSEIRSGRYRFSYEPMEGISAEGIVAMASCSSSEYSDRGEVMFTDVQVLGVEFVSIQIWDGYVDITETESGEEFEKELLELINEELI